MSPVYFLNPGGGGGLSSSSFPLEEDQQQLHLFLSPPSSSLIAARDPRPSLLPVEKPEQHDQYPQGLQYSGNSSGDHHPRHHLRFSSSFQTFVNGSTNDSHKFSSSEAIEDNKEDRERRCGDDGSSREWMPSKMRLMQKTMTSSRSLMMSDDKTTKLTLKIQDQRYHVNEMSTSSSSNYNSQNSITTPAIRVCSDCNTTTTPLWRSGPCGPKSLCNACGIRQRKARRAAAATAENGAIMTVEASSSSMANHKSQAHKEKKPCTGNNIGHSKKSSTKPPEKKLCLKKFALSLSNNSGSRGVFSRDVEEAAILLMELSYGFVPS